MFSGEFFTSLNNVGYLHILLTGWQSLHIHQTLNWYFLPEKCWNLSVICRLRLFCILLLTGLAQPGLAPQTDIAHCTDTIITSSQSVSQSVSESGLPGMSNIGCDLTVSLTD